MMIALHKNARATPATRAEMAVGAESAVTLAQRWGETPTWQYFSGNEYFEYQRPCDPAQLGRFRKAPGDEGVGKLLACTMEVVLTLKLIAKKALTCVIVDSTVQVKVNAHPTDSKLLEAARPKLVEVAKTNAIGPPLPPWKALLKKQSYFMAL
jgi:IS5 family transposase